MDVEDNQYSYVPPDFIIIRLKQKPKKPLLHNYLVVLDESETIITSRLPFFDIFNIKSFQNYKLIIKQLKKLNRKNIGIEIKIRDIRICNSYEVGKWVKCIREVYKFCKLTNNQIIISSGAENEYETISGNTFDSILRIFEVEPTTYWNDLEKWLHIKSGIYYSASEKG
ncbi:MAG: hypothetical protein ACM3VV_06635 [Deltaproteobacteria bacterium]